MPPSEAIIAEVTADLAAALSYLQITAERHGTDLEIMIGDGQKLLVEVMKAPVRGRSWAQTLNFAKSAGRPVVLVADRIPRVVAERLRTAGANYFDRSGHLRIIEPPVLIDADVPSLIPESSRAHPLDRAAGRDVAIYCLLSPKVSHPVRATARYLGRDAALVSRTMADLRSLGLLDQTGRPVVPGLFWALSDHWLPRRVALLRRPEPGQARITDQLQMAINDTRKPGWALTDTQAAQAWGMPLVSGGDYPPDFYVPDGRIIRRAELLLGKAESPDRRACTVAVTPAPIVCNYRIDRSEEFPIANHVAVALDLSLDRSRGIEALKSWRPKDLVRVW